MMFAFVYAAALLAVTSALPSNTLVSRQSPVGSVRIHPSGNTSKCLDLASDILEDDHAVDIYTCNGTPAQDWFVPVAGGAQSAIQLAQASENGATWCLDAGSPPFATRQAKIYQCFAGLAQQTWVATGDSHFALQNQNPGFCLAATDISNIDAQVTACGGSFQTWTTS